MSESFEKFCIRRTREQAGAGLMAGKTLLVGHGYSARVTQTEDGQWLVKTPMSENPHALSSGAEAKAEFVQLIDECISYAAEMETMEAKA